MKKLSEITMEQGLDIVADILAPIMNIAEDETVRDFFTKEKPQEGENAIQMALRRIKSSLPALIKKHKEDLIVIMAALNTQTVDEYKQSKGFMGLVKDVVSIANDEDLQGLFTSAESESINESSGSASENTEGAALKVL